MHAIRASIAPQPCRPDVQAQAAGEARQGCPQSHQEQPAGPFDGIIARCCTHMPAALCDRVLARSRDCSIVVLALGARRAHREVDRREQLVVRVAAHDGRDDRARARARDDARQHPLQHERADQPGVVHAERGAAREQQRRAAVRVARLVEEREPFDSYFLVVKRGDPYVTRRS